MLSYQNYIREVKLQLPKSDTKFNGIMKDKKLLGSGVQALVYAHTKDANKIIKVVNVTGENDASVQFLRLCVNHENNPYFPKVYTYKMYDNSELTEDDIDFLKYRTLIQPTQEKYMLVMVVERLMPLFHEDAKFVWNMFKSLGFFDPFNSYRNLNDLYLDIRQQFANPTRRLKLKSRITDDNLIKALRLIEPLFKNFMSDLHSDNFMIRPSTKELVIIDPVQNLIGVG